ncbi:MAG: hypothetical protein AAGF56_00870 [Pseudomonadota bacterium]
MNDTPQTEPPKRQTPEERLAEVDRLSERIRHALDEIITQMEQDRACDAPVALLKKLNELHTAHLQVIVAEERFHDKLGQDPDADAPDYDAIRADVGCKLDRLRNAFLAEGFPCDAETRAACNAALSLRLLGDAPPDPTSG